MTNRWHRAVKTATFTVSDYQFECRRQGAPSIMTTVFAFEGMGPFIEELLRGLVDLKQIQAWVAKASASGKTEITGVEKEFALKLLKTVLTRLQEMGLDVGDLAAKIVFRFPELVGRLLVQGVVLEPDETPEMFLDWLDSLSFSEVTILLKQWYQLNLEELVGPLVEKAKASARAAADAKDRDKDKPAPKAKAPTFGSGFSPAGS